MDVFPSSHTTELLARRSGIGAVFYRPFYVVGVVMKGHAIANPPYARLELTVVWPAWETSTKFSEGLICWLAAFLYKTLQLRTISNLPNRFHAFVQMTALQSAKIQQGPLFDVLHRWRLQFPEVFHC